MVHRALRRCFGAPCADVPKSFCVARLARVRILAVLVSALLLGCGPSEAPPPPVPQNREMPDLPPAEIRKILDGLTSDSPRMQYGSLNALGRFPAMAQTYREHVERLQKESKDKRVRRKATELLASLEE